MILLSGCSLCAMGMAFGQEQPSAESIENAVHKIVPGDVLDVSVVDHKELSVPAVTVGTEGQIQVPLLGSVVVASLTLDRAAEKIGRMLEKDFLRKARVNVNLARPAAPAKMTVTVVGQVARPGSYEVIVDCDLITVLANAGGLSKGASETDIEVKRRGIKKPIVVDYDKMLRGKAEIFVLQPGDIVSVQESFF